MRQQFLWLPILFTRLQHTPEDRQRRGLSLARRGR
jgi:hypothetical protein